ncbi:DUF5908 family protein [Paucibacter sp. APW11]|uniref:DUF5908 family protein n=1 Tax=Roseateles aquae TaxID=3077235 RepID=A0ABU3P8X3_9BURK|nr:DUF5908 family protein [Paucibacter sp. APW11]MDT8998201.1 DUF5908 family protein [Paucibacter sp. APW11]
MTLEVRQLHLKSTVLDQKDSGKAGAQASETNKPAAAGDGSGDDFEAREQLKEEILAECRVWLLAQLQQLRER